MGKLRLLLKSASKIPVRDPQLTTCEITFRDTESQRSTTYEQKSSDDDPKWQQWFEWSLDSAPEADEEITVYIVYKDAAKSTREQRRATAKITLGEIHQYRYTGEPRDVSTTRHSKELEMLLHVHLAYWEFDYRELQQQKERLEEEKKQVMRDLDQNNEQHDADKKRLQKEKTKLKQEKDQLKQDKEQLMLAKRELQRRNDGLEKAHAADKKRFEQDKEKLEETLEDEKAVLVEEIRRLQSLAKQMLPTETTTWFMGLLMLLVLAPVLIPTFLAIDCHW